MSSASRSPRARRSAVEPTTSVIMIVSSLAARLLSDKGYLPLLSCSALISCSAHHLPVQSTAALGHDEHGPRPGHAVGDGYVDAWRAEDPQGVERLFTDDARYGRSPYEKSEVGHDAIKAFWLADAGEIFAVQRRCRSPLTVSLAVVRVDVRYGDPVQQEYRDLWVLAVRRRRSGQRLRGMGLLAGQALHSQRQE